MPDEPPGPPSATSDCENVTVTLGAGAAPVIELGPGAVKMFNHELAELVTTTARAAAEARPEPEERPEFADAIEHLSAMRGSLAESGYQGVIDRHRAQFEDAEERDARRERSFGATPALALPPEALGILDDAVRLLQRADDVRRPKAKGTEEETPIGKATSPSRLVAVEASAEFPIHSVWLSKRACEIGPRALGAEITETAAAAGRALDAAVAAHLAGIVAVDPRETSEQAETVARDGERGLAEMDDVHRRQQAVTRQLMEGGYFA